MPVKSYRDLNVWKAAVELVICVYRRTEKFPKHEVSDLPARFKDQQFRYRQMSLKVMREHRTRNSTTFCQFLSVHSQSWKLS
jgi:hypothetical protein